jgi:DNA (cytosine-5)-methyltransferase 1
MNNQLQFQLSTPVKSTSRRPPIIRAFLGRDEILVDNFAGGGGASSGVARAFGRSPDIAINHDPEAIAMHSANHPTTRHYTESVWDVDPKEAAAGRPVALAWFSPTCTHFSKAKGTALDASSIKIRGLAWVAVRWAQAVRPRVICLENVEEFEKWGPLHREHTDGCDDDRRECRKACRHLKPIKARAGETFRAFVNKLRRLGYVVEWRQLRACDYGAPTTRKRLFMVARCDGRAIAWPEATHGPMREKAHRAAAECIDWSVECPSIFERDRPLADKTLARIARGIRKFVLDNPRPFIVPVSYGDKGGNDVRLNSIDEPLRTICGNRGGHALVTPTLFRVDHGDVDKSGKKRGQGHAGLEDPIPTICAGGGQFALATPMLIKAKTYGGGGNDAMSAEKPLGTVTASKRGEFAIAVPYLVHRSNGERPAKGNAAAQEPRIYDITKPLGTIVAQGQKHAACVALLIKHNGGNNDKHGSSGQSVEKPMDTLATHNTKALTVAHVVKLRGTSAAHIESSSSSMEDPLPTISASGTHVAAVSAFLVRYNGVRRDGEDVRGQSLTEPTSTLDTSNRLALVTVQIAGEEYVVVDIGMRMLTPRELYRAQGFTDRYIIDPVYNGKTLTKTAQIRMVGNSVPPVMAEVIARAQLEAA